MSQPWLVDGKFYVSPHNYAEEITEQRVVKPGGSTELYDSTLRKIMLVAGLRPRLSDIMEIAAAIDDVGIHHVTMNLHWWGDEKPETPEWEVSKALLQGGFSFTTTIVVDNWRLHHWQQDMEQLRGLGLVEPILSLGSRVLDRSSADYERARDRLPSMIEFCGSLGMRAGISFQDVGRVSLDGMLEVTNLAIEAGAVRISLADSISSLGPDGVRLFIGKLRAGLAGPAQLLLHTHDDFGLGTAVAVAAVTAGAEVEVSVNGISDRAGFPALEEVAVALESMYGISTGLRMERLAGLCGLVSARTLPVHPYKAISGDHAFLVDLPYAFQNALERGLDGFPPPWSCVAPAWLGTAARLNWLRQFLAAPILALKLESMGLPSDAESVERVREVLVARLEARSDYPVWLEQEEVEGLCRELLGA